jgi:CRP/FNR family transcriptional regulator, transcriptional activator FtrB
MAAMIFRANDITRLRAIHLFSRVSEAHFRKLARAASLRRFPARAVLFREGDRPRVLYTLIDGAVELFSQHHDRRCTIAVLRSVKPCVLTSIMVDRNPMSARTLESSELLLVPARVIQEMIETDAGFTAAASHELARDCRDVTEDFKTERLTTAIERLASWMLHADDEAGGTGHFALPYDKRTLASVLGMAPANLSRNLAALAPAGLVVRGRQVTLNDRVALAARSGLALSPPGE